MDDDANTRTLASYERAAERYRQQVSDVPAPTMLAFVERVVAAVPAGASTLEIGSGPGRDASLLEARGLRVRRTDATAAFVSMMRGDGQRADLLDMPRWFTYWQEPDLREVLGGCGWAVQSLDRGATANASWLAVLAEIDSDPAC